MYYPFITRNFNFEYTKYYKYFVINYANKILNKKYFISVAQGGNGAINIYTEEAIFSGFLEDFQK